MDDRNWVIVLAAIGIVCALVMSYSQAVTLNKVREFGEPLAIQLLCVQRGGDYLLSSPTSTQVCSDISNTYENVDSNACNMVSSSKKASCGKLTNAIFLRSADCLKFMMTQQTSYAGGMPDARQACEQLKS